MRRRACCRWTEIPEKKVSQSWYQEFNRCWFERRLTKLNPAARLRNANQLFDHFWPILLRIWQEHRPCKQSRVNILCSYKIQWPLPYPRRKNKNKKLPDKKREITCSHLWNTKSNVLSPKGNPLVTLTFWNLTLRGMISVGKTSAISTPSKSESGKSVAISSVQEPGPQLRNDSNSAQGWAT